MISFWYWPKRLGYDRPVLMLGRASSAKFLTAIPIPGRLGSEPLSSLGWPGPREPYIGNKRDVRNPAHGEKRMKHDRRNRASFNVMILFLSGICAASGQSQCAEALPADGAAANAEQGAAEGKPAWVFADVDDLPVQVGMPDPFSMPGGKRVKTLQEWQRQRTGRRRGKGGLHHRHGRRGFPRAHVR